MASSESHVKGSNGNGPVKNGLQDLVNELTSRLSSYHGHIHGDGGDHDEETESEDEDHHKASHRLASHSNGHTTGTGNGGGSTSHEFSREAETGFAQTRSDAPTMKESKTFAFGMKTYTHEDVGHGEDTFCDLIVM